MNMKKKLQVIASYTLMEAFRNRLIYIIAIFLLLTIGIAVFGGNLSIIEVEQTQAQILGLIYRFGAIIICSLMVISGANREFNDKNHELILSTSVTRAQYFIGKLIGYYLIGLVVCISIGLALLLFCPLVAVISWTLSVLCETLIMITSALMFATIINNLTISIILQLGFYLLARTMGAINMMVASGSEDSIASGFIGNFLSAIGYITPQLHRFANSDWLTNIESNFELLCFIALQTAIFCLFLTAVSIFDFSRKNI